MAVIKPIIGSDLIHIMSLGNAQAINSKNPLQGARRDMSNP